MINSITGLKPIPDTGYLFDGWTIRTAEDVTLTPEQTLTLQADGTYTYSARDIYPPVYIGDITVTANFAPHESHIFDCVQTPATCTEDGQNVYTCSVCGYAYTEIITAPGSHNFGEWMVTTPATTTAEGVETRACSRCKITETRTIPCLPIVPAALTVNASDTAVYTGDTFTVTVELTQNPGFAGMRSLFPATPMC